MKNYKDLTTNYILKEWLYNKAKPISEFIRKPSQLDITAPNEEESNISSKLSQDLDEHYNTPFTDPSYVGRKFLAFSRYTVDSKHINKGLIDAYKHDEPLELNPYAHREVTAIDQALNAHIKPAPFDFHVYTGIGSGLNIMQHRENVSHTMFFPAYTSTTPLPLIANKFSKRSPDKPDYSEILRIHVPKGSEYGTHLGSAAELSNEAEFLLHRGTILHYTDEPRIVKLKHPYSNEIKNVIVHNARIIRQTRSLKSQ